MNISNSTDNLNIGYINKSNEVKTVPDAKLNEVMRNFRKDVMQNLPEDAKYESSVLIKTIPQGSYVLDVESFKDQDTNEYKNSLRVSYIPNDDDFKISMSLQRGSKQDILDYLGNEKNADEITRFMKNLKDRADEKS